MLWGTQFVLVMHSNFMCLQIISSCKGFPTYITRIRYWQVCRIMSLPCRRTLQWLFLTTNFAHQYYFHVRIIKVLDVLQTTARNLIFWLNLGSLRWNKKIILLSGKIYSRLKMTALPVSGKCSFSTRPEHIKIRELPWCVQQAVERVHWHQVG